MTTAAPRTTTVVVVPGLRAALVVTAVLALAASVLAAVVAGSPAVLGALVGAAVVAAFFGLGSATVALVARVLPAASLLVALLTYTLQVLVLGLLFAALGRSGLTDATLDPRWLGGTVIAGTLAWLVALVVAAVRSRQPLYDLPDRSTAPAAAPERRSDPGTAR